MNMRLPLLLFGLLHCCTILQVTTAWIAQQSLRLQSPGRKRCRVSSLHQLSNPRDEFDDQDQYDNDELSSYGEEDDDFEEDEDEASFQDIDADRMLDYAIDSFLRGDYAYQFSESAPSPDPSLSPGETVELALRALRNLDQPEPAHGAAVLMRFCIPLSRAEKWSDRMGGDPWKEVLRSSLTPEMFAKRIRSSPFSALLDWSKLDVTEGTSYSSESSSVSMVGTPSLAFVNVALYFGNGVEPALIQFTLRRANGGAWMIDTARRSNKELFVSRKNDNT